MDIVDRLERFAKEGAGVAVLIDSANEIKKLRAELRLAQDIIGDLQRHEPVCLGESRNARPR